MARSPQAANCSFDGGRGEEADVGSDLIAGPKGSHCFRQVLFAEGRWTRVDDDLNKDFDGFGKIDLSGREIAAGVSWTL